MSETKRILKRNAVRCLSCGKELVSLHQHHFVTCGCENETFTDGGLAYQRVGGKDLDKIESLAEYEELTIEEYEERVRKAQLEAELKLKERIDKGEMVWYCGKWWAKDLFETVFKALSEREAYEPTKEEVLKLREETGEAIVVCRKALKQSAGNFDEAKRRMQRFGQLRLTHRRCTGGLNG